MFLNVKTFKHSNNQIIYPYYNDFIFQTNSSKCFRKIIIHFHYNSFSDWHCEYQVLSQIK